ncbi:MAG: hypothetical protein KDD50_03900 [Bdellovibrionales bacterium]|nr:hypothetical protein [Bdellovibrionales bacterium]
MGIKRHVTHNQAIFGQTQFSFHQKENKKDFESSADKEDDFEDHEEKTSKNFDTIFGSSELDLKEIALNDSDVNVKINTVFGETKVFVPQNFPLLVESSSAFAEIKLPAKNLNAFGNFTYENDAAKNAKYKIRIKANAVFGSIRFIER